MVIPFQRLARNVSGHKYSHVFSSICLVSQWTAILLSSHRFFAAFRLTRKQVGEAHQDGDTRENPHLDPLHPTVELAHSLPRFLRRLSFPRSITDFLKPIDPVNQMLPHPLA